jgi:uncharacterized protein (DUF362 family)
MRTRKRVSSDVAICRNDCESSAILEGLDLIKADSLISEHDVVVITPNWVKKSRPEEGIVVGNESLKTIIEYVKAKNPARLVVASGSGGNETLDSINEGSFDKVLEKEGVEFIDLNYGPFVTVRLNHDKPEITSLNKIFEQMTCLISFTQLKIHEEATISGTIKNIALSWPPAEEHGFPKKSKGIHDKLHGFIVAMSEILPVDLAILSASPAMIGTGPSKGIPKHTGFVITGTDAFSVDTVGARFMGFKPQAVNYLYEGGNRGIGQTDILKMNLYGIPLIQAEKEFSTAVYGEEVSVDAD